MGCDFGFMARFWISTTQLFVIMNSFTITERNKNQWIYQWISNIQIIWKLSYINLLRIIVWTLNYVDCIFEPPAVAGRVLWIRVCPSFHPSVLLSGSFLAIGSLVFSETQHVLLKHTHVLLCVTEPDFLKKTCPKNGENGQNIGFLKFIGKFSH